MLVFDATLLVPNRAPDAGTGSAAGGQPRRVLRRLLQPVLGAVVAQHRLLQRQRTLPRPAGCGWVPRRAWRRHGAWLCLCAGVDPDASTGDERR
jgi:hypothetical protein